MLAFMACDSKKGTSADNAEEETTANELVEEKSEAAASLDAPDADEDALEEDEALGDEEEVEMTPEEREAYENEVWPYLGGTYAFRNGEQYCALDVSLDEENRATLSIGEDVSIYCTIDPKTGFITGVDDEGKEVFRGAVYAGGNLLKGTLYGKPICYEGLCGL